jgi:hypothetical protein
VFSWTMLLDRIPTKVNLAKRRLLAVEESKWCVFCGYEDEPAIHLFLHCNVISKVWSAVMNWLQFHLITPPSLFIHLFGWSTAMSTKKRKRGAWLIWHAVIWVIWKMQNNRIFNNIVKEVDEMVEQIKVVSWNWSINRLNIASCLFYEWCWNPHDCLVR